MGGRRAGGQPGLIRRISSRVRGPDDATIRSSQSKIALRSRVGAGAWFATPIIVSHSVTRAIWIARSISLRERILSWRGAGRRISRLRSPWRALVSVLARRVRQGDPPIGPVMGRERPSAFAFCSCCWRWRFSCSATRQVASTTIQGAIVDTQLGDVTSLVDANRAGDPFTTEDSPDPPSLGLEPADPQLKLVGQPQIASLAPVRAGDGEPPHAAERDIGAARRSRRPGARVHRSTG